MKLTIIKNKYLTFRSQRVVVFRKPINMQRSVVATSHIAPIIGRYWGGGVIAGT